MKKTLLFVFAIVLSMATMAQDRAMLINESFNGSSMPSGWTIAGLGTTNWSISATNNAGGSANELHLAWSPQFNGLSRVVMPAVDLTGVTSVTVSFKHALNNYSGGHTIGIATSSDNGSTWNVGWQQSYSTSNSWAVLQDITTPDMGNSNVQFCLFYSGNSYNINDWYFDDIQIFILENLDLGANATSLPSFVPAGSIDLDLSVSNYGLTTITSVEASYTVNDQTTVTQTFDVNIASLQSATLNFTTPLVLIPGNYEIRFSIDKVNGVDDDVAENNTFTKSTSIALASVQRIPMIEHFSSSTCGPCVSVNTQMLNLTNNNPGKFTYTKYQMNWPGSGDPYYTAEGGTRRTYYSVSAVPQCFLDGEDQGYAAVTQATLDDHYNNRPAFVDMRGSFVVDGNTITVKTDVIPFIDTEARLFVSVNEKETHNNVGGNGETSFHHIFMKMLTPASGEPISFTACEVVHNEFTFDMSSTHVEEMSDLEVSIWVQNYITKEMLNSHFAYEYTSVHPYPVENLALSLVDKNPVNLVATWDAPTEGSPIGYNVYINGDMAAENLTETSYSFTGDSDMFYAVGVVALYPDNMSSVMAVTSFENAAVVCDPVTDLTAEPYVYNGDNGALVSWTEPEGATSYQIFVDDELLGATDGQPIFINFEGDPAGTYTIGIVAIYGDCQSDMATVDFEWTDPASVGEVELTTTVYPNPTTGSFTIEGADIAKVTIYNLVGQIVFEQQGNTVINIDASGWTKGMYLISITNGQGAVETRKLMVE